MVVVVVTVVVLKKSKCREIGQICHKKGFRKNQGTRNNKIIIRCSSGCGGGSCSCSGCCSGGYKNE